MVVLGGWAFSYERGTRVLLSEYFQVDIPDLRYTLVNLGAGKSSVSPDWRVGETRWAEIELDNYSVRAEGCLGLPQSIRAQPFGRPGLCFTPQLRNLYRTSKLPT